MSSILGKINFNSWEKDTHIVYNFENNSTRIRNAYIELDITGLPNENISEKIYYDQNEQIIIVYRGVILLDGLNSNSPKVNVIKKLIYLYKEKGKSFLTGINGSFNIILIDIKENKVRLCNDSVGVLRMYYIYNKNVLTFCTSIANLLNEGYSINDEGLIQYLFLNYYYDENTLFSDVSWILPGCIVEISQYKIEKFQYFNLFEYVYNLKLKNEINDFRITSGVLQKVIKDYTEDNGALITLTSGFDSRLLLSAILYVNLIPIAFTFGQKNNLEFNISDQIISKIKNLNYFQIILDDEFEKFTNNYFDYVLKSKNIELNFNRFHYLYIWEKLLGENIKSNILTGLCGDSFLRDGLEISNQTNELIYKMIYTKNKEETIKKYLSKNIAIINELGLNKNYVFEVLSKIFTPIKNNDKYFNHFFIKINFGIQRYFGYELNIENNYLNTFSPYLDIRYISALIFSNSSNLTHNFLDNKFLYQNISHKFYANMVNFFYKELLNFNTNRGYPLYMDLNNIYLPIKIVKYLLNKKRNIIPDLNYLNWRKNMTNKLMANLILIQI